MTISNFTTNIIVDQSAQIVFNAINQVKNWWQGEVVGDTRKLNDEFTYRMLDIHYSKQRLVEVIPNKQIVWLVVDSNLSFTKNKTEWTGTRIIFDISERNGKTQITFTHEGLVPKFECYGDCSNAWRELIEKSLYSLITTGKGVHVFG